MLRKNMTEGRAIAIDRMPRTLLRYFAFSAFLLSIASAPPCQGKAVIQRWQRDAATPTPIPTDVALPSMPSMPSLPVQAPSPSLYAPKDKQSFVGVRAGYYGASPALLSKGAFLGRRLSDSIRFQGGIQSGNTSFPSLTNADIREYSSYLKLPLGLNASWGPLVLGVQYANTLVSTYDRPGYYVSSIEPTLGLRWEPGDFTFSLAGSYPAFDPILPPEISFEAGVFF